MVSADAGGRPNVSTLDFSPSGGAPAITAAYRRGTTGRVRAGVQWLRQHLLLAVAAPVAAALAVAGATTWADARDRRPARRVRLVLMSGFAGAQLQERARALGIRELLRKPLQRTDIAECLGRVLPN
jgi:CheY-like chemotaxis protein